MVLASKERQTLEQWQRSTPLAAGLVRRGRMILSLAAGASPFAVVQAVGVQRTVVRHGATHVLAQRLDGLSDAPGRGAKGGFAPGGRDPRRARRLRATGPGGSSPLAVGWYRTRASAHRRGDRTGDLGLHGVADAGRPSAAALAPAAVAVPQPPRDAACDATVAARIDLSTRPLQADELVLSLDEKTSLQPRPRLVPTLPAQLHHLPTRGEPEYQRAGALHLLAAFDTRSGKVSGHGDDRKRQRKCRACLDAVAVEVEGHIRTIHLVCDHVSTPQGQEVRQWLAHQARLVMPCTPVHGSWLNHVEPWVSILQRQR